MSAPTASPLPSLRHAISQHIKNGRGKETANRMGFLDCCYGRASLSWGEGERVPIVLSFITTTCTHCGKEVLEQDAKVQAAYWTPHQYQLWHADCHAQHHKAGVIEQQKIDQDCNECVFFEATAPIDKYNNRRGICKKTGADTVAYPGGTFCNFPLHEECFQHRQEQRNDPAEMHWEQHKYGAGVVCTIAMDFAPGPDRSVVTCSNCLATHEVIDGKLPEIGWCRCVIR